MKKNKGNRGKELNFALKKKNIYLIIVAIFIITIGFLLMMGGGSDDPNVFNEEEIFSFRRITLAPIVILLGYILIAFAIMKKFK